MVRDQAVITRCTASDFADWIALRRKLWPNVSDDEHATDVERWIKREDAIAFIARDQHGAVVAFAEAALRHDGVNGCDTSPVAFLEGIYVVRKWRLRGIARALCGEVEAWGIAMGCSEFASDALVENADSHAMHKAIGFEETETVVYFRKRLTQPQ